MTSIITEEFFFLHIPICLLFDNSKLKPDFASLIASLAAMDFGSYLIVIFPSSENLMENLRHTSKFSELRQHRAPLTPNTVLTWILNLLLLVSHSGDTALLDKVYHLISEEVDRNSSVRRPSTSRNSSLSQTF